MAKIGKFVFWAPRILSILFILFLSLFSLDVFEESKSGWEIFIGLMIHNIPSIILAIILFISWKREIVGGVAFILTGILYAISVLISIIKTGFEWYYLAWIVQISGIAVFIGILFIIGWKKKRNN